MSMRALWERSWVRIAAMACAFPVVVFLSALLIGVEEVDSTTDAIIFLIPIAAFGAVIARPWALWLPLGWSAVYLAVLRIADLITGGCSVCGSDEDWSNAPFLMLFIVVGPLTAAVAVGVVLGAAVRSVRRRWVSA